MARADRVTIVILISFVTTFLTITNAFILKQQFYPAVVYLTKNNGSVSVLYFQGAVFAYLLFSLIRWIFFGHLRTVEAEQALDKLWHATIETCLAFTIFRDDLSPRFVVQFFVLFFFKGFHWLAENRVDYMERSPMITLLFHARIMGILSLLAAVDSYFISNAYFVTLQRGASAQIVFGFEYAVLLTVILHIALKYLLHINDLRSAHPWESKAVYMLYTELVVTFFRCVFYFFFAAIMIRIHTFPLFAIRPFYLTLRSFKKAVNDVIQSRRAINAMNNLYPLATEQELREGDNTCIICREEMTIESGAKKLPCNHIFHPNCLRSWFQRQQTCPTCRTDVLGASRDRLQQQQVNGINAAAQPQNVMQGADGLAALLAGLGFPQLQQAREIQRLQQVQRAQQIPNQPGGGIRVEIGFGAQGQQQFIFPAAGGPYGAQQQQAADGTTTNAQTSGTNVIGGQNPIAFPTPYPFPEPPTYAGLSDIELAQMEGRERAACEARLNALRNIQTLLDAAVFQFQQYSAMAPSVNLTSQTTTNSSVLSNTPTASTTTASATEPGSSMSSAQLSDQSTVVDQQPQVNAG